MYKNILENLITDILFEGKITEEKYERLIEKIQYMSEKRAKVMLEDVDEDVIRKTTMSALSIPGWSPGNLLVTALYRAIRGSFDQCSKACGVYALNTPKRQICMAKCKVTLYQNALVAAKKNKASATVTDELKSKLARAKRNYENYRDYALRTGRNPNPNVVPGSKSRFKIPG